MQERQYKNGGRLAARWDQQMVNCEVVKIPEHKTRNKTRQARTIDHSMLGKENSKEDQTRRAALAMTVLV